MLGVGQSQETRQNRLDFAIIWQFASRFYEPNLTRSGLAYFNFHFVKRPEAQLFPRCVKLGQRTQAELCSAIRKKNVA